MAHRRRRRSKRWLGKVLFLVLIIVAGVVCYLVWDNYFRDKTPEKPGDVSKETTKVEEVKKSEPEQETEVVEKEKVKQYEKVGTYDHSEWRSTLLLAADDALNTHVIDYTEHTRLQESLARSIDSVAETQNRRWNLKKISITNNLKLHYIILDILLNN